MATSLNIRGFVAPEQEFKGLEKLGETFAAQRAAKAKQDEADKASKKALEASLEGYIKPGDFLTGTVNDPYITKRVYDLMQKGADLAKVKGMDWSMLKSALIPEVSELSQSVEKIKEVKRGVDKSLELLKDTKGINKDKLRDEALLQAFYDKDDKGNYTLKNSRDISSIDPTFNYVDDALRNKDVFTPEAVTAFTKTQQPTEYKATEITRGKSGVEVKKEFDVKAPQLYTPEIGAGGKFTQEFVPKHELFTDKNVVQIHQFKGDKGDINAPIRVVTDDVYRTVLSDPQAAAYIRQETRKFANQFGMALDSPQAEYFSKALVYDELNKNKPATFLKEFQAQKQPLPPRQTVNVGGAKEPTINDVYDRMFAYVNDRLETYKKDPKKYGPKDYVQVNLLDSDIRNVVLKEARAATGNNELGIADIKIKVDDRGMMGMYDLESNLIGQITPQGTNIPVTPRATGKEKEVKRIPPLKSYGSELQTRIKRFMSDNKLGEQQAIQILIEQGLIPK